MTVYWTVLMERSIPEPAVDALLDVASVAGQSGFVRFALPYGRVDVTRNIAVEWFMGEKQHPVTGKIIPPHDDDYLVMLDCDHAHPAQIINRLAMHSQPVVAALAFRRSMPYDPLMFRAEGSALLTIETWDGSLTKVDAVGSGAIAIRRSALIHMMAQGIRPPFFQFQYRNDGIWSFGEDLYFCELCYNAGVPIYCDTGLITPHLGTLMVEGERWKKEHPPKNGRGEVSNSIQQATQNFRRVKV